MNCKRCNHLLRITGQFFAGHEIFVCDVCGTVQTRQDKQPARQEPDNIKDLFWLFKILKQLENEQKITVEERVTLVENLL